MFGGFESVDDVVGDGEFEETIGTGGGLYMCAAGGNALCSWAVSFVSDE